jgi:DNA polymerase-3 subunit gamma/tau
LRNAVRGERLAHAYLFAGPRGTGKTTTARLLAKAANCLAEAPGERPCNRCARCVAVNAGRFLDLIEIDAASNTSVDDVRELRERINFSPNEGRFKVYIVDEVHMLSTAAFNALLKTLEEPPAHAIFILATTEVHKIPATVLSRCQRHEFRRIPVALISDYLDRQIAKQGFRLDRESVDLIARQSTGSLRDAVSLLDQLVSSGEQVTLSLAQQVLGTASTEVVWELLETLVDGKIGKGLTVLNRALDAGADPRQLARQVVTALRAVLLIQMGELPAEEAPASDHPRLQAVADRIQFDPLLNALRAFSQATRSQPGNWQPGLALELAYLEAIHPERARPDPEPAPAVRTSASQPPGADRAQDREQDREPDPDRPPGRQPSTDVDRHAGQPSQPRAVREQRAGRTQAQASPAAPREAGGIDFQAVLDSWPRLLTAAYSRDPRAQALLNSSKPMGVSSAGLVLGFQSDLLREKMEKGHNAELILEALEEVLGGPLEVRCVLIEEWEAKSTTAAPPVQDGGMVAMALRDLGGQVVDFEQLPPPTEEAGEAA